MTRGRAAVARTRSSAAPPTSRSRSTRPGAYDLPSYDIIYNVYQNLLQIPPGGNKPVPEAAESCDFTDDDHLRVHDATTGVKFSDGSPLTAEDVKFSFERNVKIADPNGASSLLANMKSIEAPDPKTVVFHLKAPDATWPLVLATASSRSSRPTVFPADKLQADDKVVGSGRYTVAAVRARPADRARRPTTSTRARTRRRTTRRSSSTSTRPRR